MLPDTTQGAAIAEWLQRLAADHDGTALIVAKTVGSLMIEDGPGAWFKLSRICYLTRQSSVGVQTAAANAGKVLRAGGSTHGRHCTTL
jgi:hypothetical protein